MEKPPRHRIGRIDFSDALVLMLLALDMTGHNELAPWLSTGLWIYVVVKLVLEIIADILVGLIFVLSNWKDSQ